MIAINLVAQQHARGCGPAVLAMLTGHSYASVCAHFGISFDETGIYFQDLAEYLANHGFALATKKRFGGVTGDARKERACWPPPPSGFSELCNVQVFENSPVTHFCVRRPDGVILDPMFGEHFDGLSRYFAVNSVSTVHQFDEAADLTNEQAEAAYDAAPADPISDEEAESLVRIATAKGVTEALRDLINVYDNGTVIDLENEFEKARAAIAKATGGE